MRAKWLVPALTGFLLGAAPQAAFAQQAAGEATLDATQQLGRRLFTQSCGVCHLKPQITSPTYGPMLSKESLSGDAEALRTVIGNGTPRMPGFKHHFSGDQIAAIAAYVKTMPVPPAPPAAAKK